LSRPPLTFPRVTKVFVWLFATLAFTSLTSPPGASHDEWFHISSIWCAQGARDPYCTNIGKVEEIGYSADLNFAGRNCQANPRDVLLCPPNAEGGDRFAINGRLYPGGFYLFLSPLASNSLERSVVLMRWVSALMVSIILAVVAILLPSRHRLVLLLVMLAGLGSSGYFLLASINPSSWVLFGVGVGWLTLHAAVSGKALAKKRRIALVGVWLLTSAIASLSRWDAIPYVGIAAIPVLFRAQWHRFPTLRKQLIACWLLAPFLTWLILERISPFLPIFHYKTPLGDRQNISQLLYTYLPGQPNNLSFFTENLLQALPNALRALGTIPTMTTVRLPEIVFVTGIVVLSFMMAKTYNRALKSQFLGFIFIVACIAFVVAAQVALLDNRDFGGIEPRYLQPLLLVAIGWWFLLGPDDLPDHVMGILQPVVATCVASFSLVNFTTLERFVDRQTDGIRLLPEGSDQWWWTGLPFGPNIVVFVAPACLGMFLTNYLRVVAAEHAERINS
jgi:hypothetical protein